MTGRHRSNLLRGTTALLGALLVLAPGAVWAHGGSHRHDGHHGNRYDDARHGRARVPVYYHGDSCSRTHASHDRRHRARHHRRHQEARYSCQPCRHRFHTRHAFHDHLVRHHRVARWLVPYVVVHHALGWVFYG